MAGTGACVCPTGAAACRITPAAQDIEHIADDRGGLAGIDPRWRCRRADLDAFRAAGATFKDIAHPGAHGGDECLGVIGHSFPFCQAGDRAAVVTTSLLS